LVTGEPIAIEDPMMEPTIPEHVKALYDRMQDAMIPLVQRHVVSIAAYYNGGLHQHATGTLVQFSDHYFVVTAAHAIEDYDKAKEAYPDLHLLIDNGDSEDLVPLDGHYHATQTVRDPEKPRRVIVGHERDDLWDIGLWELDRHVVDGLTTKRFLNRASISITDDLTTGAYLIAGFPCSWAHADSAKRSAKWRWLRYVTHPYPEKDTLPKTFDERFHLALCLGDDPVLPAQLEGISGCPIWRLSDTPVKEDWSVDEAKVVAVETCVYRDRALKAIRGTKWRWVVKVLADMHPEIWEAFNLWLPGKE
jgi:hypothetical protein